MNAYVATYIEVQPGRSAEAVALIGEYAERMRGETGCLAVDALQELHRQNRFAVIEAWDDDSSHQAHEAAVAAAEFRSRLRDIHKSPYDQRIHHGFEVGARGEATPSSLFIVTHVDVPPPRREETEILLRGFARQIRSHEGNLRFDIFQQEAPRTNHFTMVAVWSSGPAFALHEANPETRQFRESLAPMLGALYDERLYGPMTAPAGRLPGVW
jgi:quinol monooxygenase YgiN